MKGLFLVTLFILASIATSAQTLQELNDSLEYYITNKKYDNGIAVGEKVITATKKEFGDTHQEYVDAITNVGVCYFKRGMNSDAIRLCTEAVTVTKRLYGPNHPEYASCLDNLAQLYRNTGQYEKAEPLFLESIKVLGEDHADYSNGLNNLGLLYRTTGQYVKAEELFNEALTITKRDSGENHRDYAALLENLAVLFSTRGENSKAETHYLQVLKIRKNVFGEKDPEYASALNNIGLFYARMGQYAKAEPLLLQAAAISKEEFGETGYRYAINLNNLAFLYNTLGNYEKAEPLCIKTTAIFRKVLGENHPDLARSLNRLGTLYFKKGEYSKAIAFHTDAMIIQKRIFGENHSDYAGSLINLADINKEIGEYRKAEELFTEAMTIQKLVLGEFHADYAASLGKLALLYSNTGDMEKAEPLLLQESKITLENLVKNFVIFSEKEKQEYLNNKVLLQQINNSVAYISGIPRKAILRNNFDLQLVFKSLTLADTKSIISGIQESSDTAIQKLFEKWQTNRFLLSRQYALPQNRRRSDLSEFESITEGLEKELNRRSSVFRSKNATIQFSTKDIQNALEQGEVAIEFVKFKLYNKSWTDSIIYAAYILKKSDSIPVFVPLFEEKQLQALFDSAGSSSTVMVNSFYRGGEVKNKKAALTLGKELYNLIWAPLEKHLKGIKKINYSPAGKLHSIAFHALQIDSSKNLMDKYQLNQLSSTRQIALRSKNVLRKSIQSVALFGDARFTIDSTELANAKVIPRDLKIKDLPQQRGGGQVSWADLPGTGEEVRKINQLFEDNKTGTQLFTRGEASEENLKSLSGHSPDLLHIATHGFFLPEPASGQFATHENNYSQAEDPLLRSGLILRGGNYAWGGRNPIDGVEDGIVTAYEIAQLNLSRTELVVLSACETALGDIKGSEGVFGLQRAFKMAGVKKMIVSLWQVPDKETAELMTTFYIHWLKGSPINEAFTRAQTDMRKKYSSFYWAAFVLVE